MNYKPVCLLASLNNLAMTPVARITKPELLIAPMEAPTTLLACLYKALMIALVSNHFMINGDNNGHIYAHNGKSISSTGFEQ
jgi:hypothetical protein